jgi:hypothetical protein
MRRPRGYGRTAWMIRNAERYNPVGAFMAGCLYSCYEKALWLIFLVVLFVLLGALVYLVPVLLVIPATCILIWFVARAMYKRKQKASEPPLPPQVSAFFQEQPVEIQKAAAEVDLARKRLAEERERERERERDREQRKLAFQAELGPVPCVGCRRVIPIEYRMCGECGRDAWPSRQAALAAAGRPVPERPPWEVPATE